MIGDSPTTTPDRYTWLALGALGVVLQGALMAMSPMTQIADGRQSWAVLLAVALMVAVGGVYLLAMVRLNRAPVGKSWFGGMIVVGVLLRIAAVASSPIIEDDYFRYLWDGAVVTQGSNPYAVAPADVPDDPTLSPLAKGSPQTLASINHPELRTIYPPTAQAVFAVAHVVAPWELNGLRGVFLLFDLLTLGAVIVLLKQSMAPIAWSAVYWCNPLVVQQAIGGAHMDLIAVALAAWAMVLAVNRLPMLCGLVLALAVGAKVWPILLAPMIAMAWWRKWHAMGAMAVTFTLMAALLYMPVYLTGLGDNSGFGQYAERWENNSLLFGLHTDLWEWLLPLIGVESWWAGRWARYATMIIVCGVALAAAAGRRGGAAGLALGAAVIIGAAFMLSPTQFPWYYLWLVPWLAVRRGWALLAYTALLPLYYLQWMGEWVVWVQHLPVLVALAIGSAWRLVARARELGYV